MRTSGHLRTPAVRTAPYMPVAPNAPAALKLCTIRLQGGPTAVQPTLPAPLPIALKIT